MSEAEAQKIAGHGKEAPPRGAHGQARAQPALQSPQGTGESFIIDWPRAAEADKP
jgi:hypothetical protein